VRLDETARNWAWVLAGMAVAACFLVATAELRQMGRNLTATNGEAQRAARILADYAEQQTARLQSEKNQKALEAGIAVAATWQATGRIFNTQTLPRINRELDALHETTLALRATVWETKAAIAVNAGHVSEILVEARGATEELRGAAKGLRLLSEQTGASVPELAGEFKALIASGRATTAQINKLLADPNLPDLVAQAQLLLNESCSVAANLNATTAQFPPLVATARRWQTPLNLARLLSMLVGLF